LAISYVGGRGAGTAGQGGGSVAISTGLTGGSGGAPIAGDLVLVTISVGTAARQPALTIATPTGFTALTANRTTSTTYDTNVRTSWKFMTSTPDTAVTIPASGNNNDGIAYVIQVFRGVDPASFPQVTPTYAVNQATDNLPDPASITPNAASSAIVICGGGAAAAGGTYTAGYLTNFLTYNGPDTNDGNVGCGYLLNQASGTPYDGAKFGGGSVNAANSWGCTTIALNPLVNAYVLTAGSGSFSETGTAVGLLMGRALSAGAGSFAESGTDASLKYNRALQAGAGSFSMAGQDVALLRAAAMIAAAGGFSLVGQDVDLVYTQGNAYVLAADPGSFALAGEDVALLKGFHLAVGVGAFSLTGQNVAFPRNYRIAPSAGVYSLQGRPVSLVYSGGAPAGAKDTYIVGLRRRRRT